MENTMRYKLKYENEVTEDEEYVLVSNVTDAITFILGLANGVINKHQQIDRGELYGLATGKRRKPLFNWRSGKELVEYKEGFRPIVWIPDSNHLCIVDTRPEEDNE